MNKKWIPVDTDNDQVQELQSALGIHPLLCRLLVQRDIRTFDQARHFFRPSADQLHDPFLMKDMEPAVERLSRAVKEKEKILLFGDYDVDGITAVVLVFQFLTDRGVQPDYYLPDRHREGYGLSFEGIDYAHREGAGLIISLDCGIQAVAQAERARDLGIDLIICDHHLPGPVLPAAAAVLDPKREDCAYPYDQLSGCGVAFKLVQAYARRCGLPEESWRPLLDLLVVSIASDIVPITGENRTLAWLGLRELRQTSRPGLRALLAASGRQAPIRISDIVFGLAPMINAAGRMADADQAVRLLLAGDRRVAEDYARVLAHRNTLRREFDQRLAREASALFEAAPDWEQQRSLVLYQPHWHQGVLGIAASRMVEKYYRPSIIMSRTDHLVVGSARSIRGLDIHEAIHRCGDLLIGFGGHHHAAGLRMHPGNVAAFQDRFEAVVREMITPDDLTARIEVAAEVSFDQLTPGFLRILKQFAPFGPGNRNPVFVARGVRDTGYSRLLDGNHLRLSLRQEGSEVFSGIAFNGGAAYPQVAGRQPFDICFTLEEDHFRGERRLQLMVKDMKF